MTKCWQAAVIKCDGDTGRPIWCRTIGGRTMVLFAKCLQFRIVVLMAAPWYGGCNCLMHDCCTMVVFVAPCGGSWFGKC